MYYLDNTLSSHPPSPHILPSSPPLPPWPCAEDLCSLVLKGDGCRLVLSAMRRHKTVPVQHAGLSALCNMAISGETGKQRTPAQSASLHFTQVHSLHCPCSLVECLAVSVFSAGSCAEGNRKGLCDVGVVQGVMAAFECCPHSEWVVFTGAQVFQNISGTGKEGSKHTCTHGHHTHTHNTHTHTHTLTCIDRNTNVHNTHTYAHLYVRMWLRFRLIQTVRIQVFCEFVCVFTPGLITYMPYVYTSKSLPSPNYYH